MKRDFPIIFKPLKDGGYSVQGYDVPGCITFGETIEEAELMAEDALNLLLYDEEEDKIPTPTPIEQISLEEGQIIRMIRLDTEAYKKEMEKYDANPIKYAREKKGWNLKQLAEFLNAPYRTMQDWNSGQHFPPRWIQDIIVEKIYSA